MSTEKLLPENMEMKLHQEEPSRLYGLVGHPLGHSFSQRYFRRMFSDENISADYLNFDLEEISTLRTLVDENPRLCGLNVTIPYKRAVMPFLDYVDEAAQRIGAVNVIRIDRKDGSAVLTGYNSDCTGFGAMLDSFAIDPTRDKALVLGTGGASLAVREALRMRGIGFATVSRAEDRGDMTYRVLMETPQILSAHRILINATPLGTYPDVNACPQLDYNAVTVEHIAMDLVYNPAITLFLNQCAAHGAAVCNGYHMLIAQAREAWRLWTIP